MVLKVRTLIKNGTVVNASLVQRADVILEGERIASVVPTAGGAFAAEGAFDATVDAQGCYVFPGFIDTHTHFDLDTGFARTADDFLSGGRAAALGGTTTVLDFATQDRGSTLKAALEKWHGLAAGCPVNYGFHMAITDWSERTCAELPEMSAAGVTSYKMYMVYDALMSDDGDIYSAMKAASGENALVGVHCENSALIRRITAEVKALGILGPEGHPLSRPAEVEAEAVARYMRIAALAKAPAYVVHLSTKEGLAEARRARERGQEVFLETCPQYLVLTDECYSRPDGAKFVMSPPLRRDEDRDALWQALSRGEINAVGTDHCSFTMAQKARGRYDFTLTPNGGAGVQHRAQLIYTYGVEAGRMPLEGMANALSYAPSRLFGMAERGEIRPGAAADVVVWDPSTRGVITDSNHAYDSDNTPFAGLAVSGGARHVFINGEHAVDSHLLVRRSCGRYIARTGRLPL